MIGDFLQPVPFDVFDVHVIEAGELMAHDPLVGVGVLLAIGERGERVPQGAERNAVSSINLQPVNQGGENLRHFVDVGGVALAYPRLAAGLPEHERIIRTQGNRRFEGVDGFRPERDAADRLSLPADGMNPPLVQIHHGLFEYGAIGRSESTIHSEQDHRLELNVGVVDELSHVGGREVSQLPSLAQFSGTGLLEAFAEVHGAINPSTVGGVVEHRNDAGSLTVVSVRAELATQHAAELGEVFRAQVADQAGAFRELQESFQSTTDIGHVSGADVAGGETGLLFVDEQVSQLLAGEGFSIVDDARHSAGVQVMLHAIVFSESTFPVTILPEVIQVSFDPFLESAVTSGLRGESLDCPHLVTTVSHAGTIATNAENCTRSQMCSQSGYGIFPLMQETPEKQSFGSVAQRLEQGTHNPTPTLFDNRKHAAFLESCDALSAKIPESSLNGSQNTTPPTPEFKCRHCGGVIKTHRRSRTVNNPLAFCSRFCKDASQRGKRQKVHDGFHCPESTKADRVRANGIVNMRIKRGCMERPKRCQYCDRPCRTDGHHPDYAEKGVVLFLCRSCHMKCHHTAGFEQLALAKIQPVSIPSSPTSSEPPSSISVRRGFDAAGKGAR